MSLKVWSTLLVTLPSFSSTWQMWMSWIGLRTTILLVEQNLRAALAVADRHHVMNKGEICFTGSSAELAGNDFVLRNYLSV
jgi:ABC-type branched-subunit amino acid transport system ATPase component